MGTISSPKSGASSSAILICTSEFDSLVLKIIPIFLIEGSS